MKQSRLNRLQMWNQRLIRRSLSELKLIGSITIKDKNIIHVEKLDWEEYWNGCQLSADVLARLNAAWINLISSGHAPTCYGRYVSAYFALLKSCLSCTLRGEMGLHVLRKIIGFETFHIFDQEGHSVSGTFNARNPAYLLCKLAQPSVFDDPKFLPLICPFNSDSGVVRLFCHYRRIVIADTDNVQVFLYPPVAPFHQPASYALIGRLFRSLTVKNDPWVEKRSETLFDCIFGKLFADCAPREVRMIDVGCGSGRVTVELCKRAYAHHRTAFDLTLLDIVRSHKSLAEVFRRSPSVFHRLVFRRNNLLDWVDDNSDSSSHHFDIVLMLRVLDVFSRFHIEALTPCETTTLIRRDRHSILIDSSVLDPAKLVESNMHHKIQHSIKRTRLRKGVAFYQFSLSDYFKAMSMISGVRVDEGCDMVYVPVRRFDDDALVPPSGRSLVG
ncbi:MAG: class I SAM-dependent methyltransferase [Pirellulales bacterium]|nr:class I SAM-dependent methyltransferase [Pirellulales bacterium]